MLPAVQAEAEGEGPPNILILLADDMRADQLRYMSSVEYRLAPNGLTFSQALVPDPLCCPSRTSLLRGQFSQRTGIWANQGQHGGLGKAKKLLAESLPVWLRRVGYRTGLIGKFLNGYENTSYVPPGWDFWRAQTRAKQTAATGGGYYNYSISENGVERRYGWNPEDYIETVLTDYAGQFLQETPADQPFFLEVSYRAPHFPWIPAPGDAGNPSCANASTIGAPSFNTLAANQPAYLAKNAPFGAAKRNNVGRKNPRFSCESLLSVDRSINTILDVLEQSGRLENTLVFFTSDNGLLFGEHRWDSKNVPYQESIRVPLVARWDLGGLRAGGTDASLAYANIDLTATIVEVAGAIATVPQDGTSLLTLSRDASTPWRERALIQGWDPPNVGRPVPGFCGMRHVDGMKLVLYDASDEPRPVELYDLVADPFELNNLADNPLYLVRKLQMAQELHEMCVPGPPGYNWPL